MDSMPDDQKLIGLTCEGLRFIPGVGSVEFIKPGEAIADITDKVIIPVASPERNYGKLSFTINTALEFEPYRPYLQNLSNYLYTILENRDLLKELKRAHDGLERRVEERTARLSKMESIVSSSTDMMALLDKNFTYLIANRAYLDAHKKTLEELTGHTPREVFGDVFFNEVIRPNAERCMAGEEAGYQRWFDFPAYKHIYMDIHYYPYCDKDNKIAGFVVNGRNITGRKQAEEEARREAETTKNLLRLSEVTSKIIDIDELMKNVVEVTRDISCVDLVLSYLWDEAGNAFRPAQDAGLDPYMLPLFRTSPITPDMPLIKAVMDSGRVFMECKESGSGPLESQKKGLLEWIQNVRTISLLPLVGKKGYRGLVVCICFYSDLKQRCLRLDKKKELMQAIASQVSTSLDESNHYRESLVRAMELSRKVETIETMSAISKSILSTMDVHEIIEVTARMVSRLIPCDWVRIIEVEREKEEFNFIAGFEEGGNRKVRFIPFASTSMTEVVDSGRLQYIADMRAIETPCEIERELAEQGYLSALRTPIFAKGEIIAVLGLMSRRAAAFNSDHLSTLNTLAGQVGVALDNARLVTDLEEFSVGTVMALAETIDAKSPWTAGHSERVTAIALGIGGAMGYGTMELNDLRMAGLLHDIGKIATGEAILDKPGPLTDEEFDEIKKHPARGAEILSHVTRLTPILPVIRSHHERYDGKGYPRGLKGADIPLSARILMVADTIDAMGAERPYRKGLPKEKIIAELKRCSGSQFDPKVIEAYFDTFENYMP